MLRPPTVNLATLYGTGPFQTVQTLTPMRSICRQSLGRRSVHEESYDFLRARISAPPSRSLPPNKRILPMPH
jgi:hypothetical protein